MGVKILDLRFKIDRICYRMEDASNVYKVVVRSFG